MARPKNSIPKPLLEKRGHAWRIRWWDGTRLYRVSLGPVAKEKADALYHLAGLALAGRDEWPEELAGSQDVRLYIMAKQGLSDDGSLPETADALTKAYFDHQRAKSKSHWPQVARTHIERFFDHVKEPANINSRTVMGYLDALASYTDNRSKKNKTPKTLSNGTRNRARAALSGFFGYMRKIGMRPRHWNPLDHIPPLREEHSPEGIVVWEDNEVPALLDAADRISGGIGIWVSTLAGLRRGEVKRLEWSDVTASFLLVRKSKTGTPRQVPLSAKLAERLKREPHKGKFVVAWPEKENGWVAASRAMMGIHLPRALKALHAEDAKQYPKRIADLPEKHPEKFGWYPFRHTFASRLAQAGHSLDLISAWLGDSPKVCKDHYARFVPKNRRDQRIDDVDP